MHISMGVQQIVSVRAVALPNRIDKKSCERDRERFMMRMSAVAQCSCRRGAVVGLYGQRVPPPAGLLARPLIADSCVFTW